MAETINLAPLFDEITRLKLLMAHDESDTRKQLSRLPNPRSFEEQEDLYRYRSRVWSEFRNRNDMVRREIDYIAAMIAETERMKNPPAFFVGNLDDPDIAARVHELTHD